MTPNRQVTSDYFQSLQETLCQELERFDEKGAFHKDLWSHSTGGGGNTCVIQNGGVFEKGGINFSAVEGALSDTIAGRLDIRPQKFFATGISIVLHPLSPMIPTVHSNFRYLELEDGDFWFGGGADLTPYYLFEDDVLHFHEIWKQACDGHDRSYYPAFKKACDQYFFLPHRQEARGVGGIFFDYLRVEFSAGLDLVKTCGTAFTKAYVPILLRRRSEPWGDRERDWQLHRRGRYAEFNLVYDRGTAFGLETHGRTESILMSLPPLVRWPYNYVPEAGSREDQLMQILRTPRDWIR